MRKGGRGDKEERAVRVTEVMEKHIRTHSADAATDYPYKNAVSAIILPDGYAKGRF